MTVSDALAAAGAAAVPSGSPERPAEGRGYMHMRARGYRSLPVVGKLVGWFGLAWSDLRSAWWTPASLPTVALAWSERIPDRERVPGDSALLWRGWVVYAHTVGLAVPLAVTAVVGVLTPLVWAARHPARLLLAGLIVGAFTALVFK